MPDLTAILPGFIILLFSLTIHEFAHAWTANIFGDDTARLSGRMTLNPVAHIDPIGTLAFPLLAMFTGFPLIGWAKPVPVNPLRLRKYKRDDILVSLAGIGANLLAAFLAALALRVLGIFTAAVSSYAIVVIVRHLIINLMIINVALSVFNLLPIPPLDGSHVLHHFLPHELAWQWEKLIRANFFLLLIILYVVVRILPLESMIEVPLRAFFMIAGIKIF